MANEISLVTASGRTVTPKDDAIIYEVFSPGNGIIYGGVVTIKDSSTLHITAGHGIVCGRKFTIDDSDIPVSLSGSGSLLGRLYIHLDLSDVADPITLLVETGATLTPEVHDSDVNIDNGVYDINIATFTVDTVTIDNLVSIDNTIAPIDFGTADISGIGDGSIKGAISELNADIASVLEWKFVDRKTGVTPITIPSNAHEVNAIVRVQGASSVTYSITVPASALSSSPLTERGGYYVSSTNSSAYAVSFTDTSVTLASATFGDTEYRSTSTMELYYR